MLIIITLFTPLPPTLVALSLIGIAPNWTSSVLYGKVPEPAPSGDTSRAFAIFQRRRIGRRRSEVPVTDGINHPGDIGGVARQAGVLRYLPTT